MMDSDCHDSLSAVLDDLFHACAFAAFLDQAILEGGWPDEDETRQRAYDLYEIELAVRNRRKAA